MIRRRLRLLETFNRTTDEDPLKAFNFIVEIDGFARFGFAKCSELQLTVEDVKYREGGDNTIPRKSQGLADSADITLERGQILATGYGDTDFMDWMKKVMDVAAKKSASSKTPRKTVEIVQRDKEGNDAVRWRVKECWPKMFGAFSSLEGLASNNSLEKLVLVNEGFERV